MTAPTPAQQLEEVLAKYEIVEDRSRFPTTAEIKSAQDAAWHFVRDNAHTLRHALAALEAVKSSVGFVRMLDGCIVGTTIKRSLPDGDYTIIPADAVEVSRRKRHDGPCWRNSHADCGC